MRAQAEGSYRCCICRAPKGELIVRSAVDPEHWMLFSDPERPGPEWDNPPIKVVLEVDTESRKVYCRRCHNKSDFIRRYDLALHRRRQAMIDAGQLELPAFQCIEEDNGQMNWDDPRNLALNANQEV